MLTSPDITGCDKTCEAVHEIKTGTDVLYGVNFADMLTEIVALVLIFMGVCFSFAAGKNSYGGASHMIAIVMCCFAIADTVMQIISLMTAVSIEGATVQLQEAKCLDVTNVNGLQKHDILTKLADSVGLSLVLGIVELVLTSFEMCFNFALAVGEDNVQMIGLVLTIVFQLFETIITMMDFLVVTESAKMESDNFFSRGSVSEMQDQWCSLMRNTSAICIAEERGMTATLMSAAGQMCVSRLSMAVFELGVEWVAIWRN